MLLKSGSINLYAWIYKFIVGLLETEFEDFYFENK